MMQASPSQSVHNHRAMSSLVFTTAVVLLCCVARPATAQVFDAYLQPEHDDPALPIAPRASWLGGAELRVQPEFTSGSQNTASYSVRFRPRPYQQRRLDSALFDIENEQLKLQWQQHYGELVAQRYLRAITLAEAEAQLWQAEQRRLADRSNLSTERALAANARGVANVSSLQQAILQLSLSENKVVQMGKKVVLLRSASMGAYFEPRAEDIGLSVRLASPQQVAESLVQVAQEATSGAHALRALQLNSQHAIQRLALERTERKFGLSLLELGYDDKQNDSYNLTLGFRIPGRRSSSGEARRSRELIKAEQEAHLANLAFNQQLSAQLASLHLDIEVFALNVDALDRHRTQISQAAGSDGRAQQLLHEHELKLQNTVVAQHAQVLRGYVGLLAFTGLLAPASKNWLRGGAL